MESTKTARGVYAMSATWHSIQLALLGGVFIGSAASLMLWLNGRVTGISGIISGLSRVASDNRWRLAFIAGLLAGGFCLRWLYPQTFGSATASHVQTAIAGVLVGVGTVMGSGCTSGHGVCGISRGSVRSIAATMTFIAIGMITVAIARGLL
jgi:uncharacterized protein